MPHPFGNDENRFGSAAFAETTELAAKGWFEKSPDAIYAGMKDGRPLWYKGAGGVLLVAGARSGKLRDILAHNICSGVLENETLVVFDIKGELAAISQDQTPDEKHCLYWNPHGLHGLPQHRINPVGHLTWSSPTLIPDLKLFLEGQIASSGAGQSRYFEQGARRIGEAIGLILTKRNGTLTLPDFHDAILALQAGGDEWIDLAFEMYRSKIPECVAVEEEIAHAREDSSGGFKGILGELMQAFACFSDPTLRAALSGPFDADLADLTRGARAYQFYLMCPETVLSFWAPVIKAFLTGLRTLKGRSPQSPRQTWIIDEAARLTGYEEIVRLFTDGAGIGIRPLVVLQDVTQAEDLARNALRKITSSAALQIYFGVRDPETARRVSDMVGAETLTYDDPLHQGRARVDLRKGIVRILSGGDPFEAALELTQKRYESTHLSKQRRMILTLDEVIHMGDDRMVLISDGLSGPVFAERKPYWALPWMAGRYHPNPYHPPTDKVLVATRRGPRWWPVIVEPVPARYAQYPQYAGGTWSRIGR